MFQLLILVRNNKEKNVNKLLFLAKIFEVQDKIIGGANNCLILL
jgi:hypothetical protein